MEDREWRIVPVRSIFDPPSSILDLLTPHYLPTIDSNGRGLKAREI
jgi:hypothetical protein